MYLQAAATINDTFCVLLKTTSSKPYYAVASLFNDVSVGMKSYTITSTLQGVDCYIRNFLADLQIDNTAKLTFTIGSLYGVKRIYFPEF